MRKHSDLGILMEAAGCLEEACESGVSGLNVWSREEPRDEGGVAIS